MNRIVVFSFSEFLTLLERRTTQSKIDGGVPFQQEFLHLSKLGSATGFFVVVQPGHALYQRTTLVMP
jgi:hypothetical protein